MALTWDQISGITEKTFVKKMADNIFDLSALTARLKKKSLELLDGGTSIMQPLNYAMISGAQWFSGMDTLSIQDNETATAAEYSWKQHHVPIVISRLDELKNSGDRAVLNHVKEKAKVAEKTFADQLGTGVYSNGTDPKSIVGLRQIVGTSNTVGGISQGSYSWWAAQVDSSTTTLTMAALQSLYNSCSVDNDHPTVGATTRAIYNLYYALLQPQQRFTDAETAKGGFQNLMFNGIPIIADSKCPASHLFFLNENYLHLYVHKDENMRMDPFQKPVNQNGKIAHIYWAGAFGSSNNRLHGKLSAIAA